MSDLIREINDELQADKLAALWQQFQTPLIVGAVALVLGTAGFTMWNTQKTQTYQAETTSLINALNAADQGAALAKVAEGKDHSVLAPLLAAGLIAKTDSAKAIALYDQVIADKNAPHALHARAILDRTMLQLNDVKTMKADETLAALKTIADKKDLFAGEANLLSGIITKNIQQKPDAAELFFKAVIDDKTAPESLKDRARALLAVVNLAAGQ